MSKRAWTPGPWKYSEIRQDGGITAIVEIPAGEESLLCGCADQVPHVRADYELIALSPDMAEAILALASSWEDGHRGQSAAAENMLMTLAEKLRAISERESG